jgi:hypothetical protein
MKFPIDQKMDYPHEATSSEEFSALHLGNATCRLLYRELGNAKKWSRSK